MSASFDPAVEAAKRAREQTEGRSMHVQRVAAAREALRLIREWYENPNTPHSTMWEDFRKLIYTTEELNAMDQ